MKYRIVSAADTLHLDDAVNSMIGDGWIPQGGISVVQQFDRVYICQAMIKHATRKKAQVKKPEGE